MRYIRFLVTCFVTHIALQQLAFSQTTDLLSETGLAETAQKEYIKGAFKSTRVINSQSFEFLHPGTMDFRILHRFGEVNDGLKNLFGLDEASMRMGFDFGIRRNLMLGVGRSTFKKELDGFIKYAPLQQSIGPNSLPFTLALVGGATINTLPWSNPSRANKFSHRVAYYFQSIVGRKFSEKFTLQVSPTIVHNNLVALATDRNDVFTISTGGRYKISKRMALMADYSYVFNNANRNPLSLGLDIETGGHVFQLHFSNATGMNERAFITETIGSWGEGDIRFGFNISRTFQIKKKKLKNEVN
jgi:hypothetical protein